MSGSAIASMIAITGLVWGGFLFLLRRAVVSEGRKRGADRTRPDAG